MKNYFKYIILLFLIIGCSANKNVRIGLVKFKLPKEAVKIASEKLDSISTLNQKIIKSKDIYKINDVYFATSSNGAKGEIKKDLLKDSKRGFDYQMKDFGFIESHQYKSSLEKVNNKEVHIMYEFYENIGQYSFRMVSKDNTQILAGRVVFENQSNYEEATKILNDFLKSVKFE